MTQTPQPPVWLLDVDGVINADRPGWHARPTRRHVYADTEYRIRWAPQLVAGILRLHHAGLVELRWCTTWCPYANLLEDLWSLPPLPRALDAEICEHGSPAKVDAAKVAAARAVLTEARRLVWTDDTAVPAFGPLYRELTSGNRALLIRPGRKAGLLAEHLDQIEAFAAT